MKTISIIVICKAKDLLTEIKKIADPIQMSQPQDKIFKLTNI